MNDIRSIKVCDMHTGGHPLRIVTGKYPPIKGRTILDKRRYHHQHLDYLRKFLMYEPRGHGNMYGAVFVEKDLEEADFAVLFLHNEGYSTMCGHAVIALARYAVDNDMVLRTTPSTSVNIQAPCGLVRCTVTDEGAVSFVSVPSFAFATDLELDLPESGTVRCDISYGGAFYAILPASRLGLRLDDDCDKLKRVTRCFEEAVNKKVRVEHPEDDQLSFLYGVILTDDQTDMDQTTHNICLFADQQVDRSPTGSGVTARMALDYAKGLVRQKQTRSFVNPLTGSEFKGRVVGQTECGDKKAVLVQVSGQAYYSGTADFCLEEEDTIGRGFLIK